MNLQNSYVKRVSQSKIQNRSALPPASHDNPKSKIILHRTWLRLLPYAMFGAFLIALKSADSFSGILQNYIVLFGVQATIILLYFIAAKSLKKEK